MSKRAQITRAQVAAIMKMVLDINDAEGMYRLEMDVTTREDGINISIVVFSNTAEINVVEYKMAWRYDMIEGLVDWIEQYRKEAAA